MDWTSLIEAVAGSVVAGVGITLAFATGVRGLIRAGELRAEGRGLGAGVWAAIGATGLLIAIAATIIGLVIVASDGPAG